MILFSTRGPESSTRSRRAVRAKGPGALPDLRRKAIEFGDQGSYPYEAVSNLLQQVKGHPEVVRR